MPRKRVAAVVLVPLMFVVVMGLRGLGQAAGGKGSNQTSGVPKFEVDPAWQPKLPDNQVMGAVDSVAVDKRDHVWILQRPGTLKPAQKDHAALPVLEFDAAGTFVQ